MAEGKSSARARAIGNRGAGAYRLDDELDDLGRHLELCFALIVVCVEALRAQNADHDADIALVLQRTVGYRLTEQIEKAAALAARCKQPRS